MSNERTANGGRLTRAMHKAAAALYAATVLGGGSDSGAEGPQESVLGHSETPKCNKKGRFELNATRLFLTYPQTDTPKEVALMRVKEHFKDNLKGYLIAQELHKGEASLFW